MGFRDFVWRVRLLVKRTLRELRLEWLRYRVWNTSSGEMLDLGPLRIRVTNGPNAYMQFKDEMVRRIYAFSSASVEPRVIDGGANMGVFALSTLRDHPRARITAFEPDPAIYAILRENLALNGAAHVTTINAALGAADGEMSFVADGQAGGALDAGGQMRVSVVPLSRYLTDDVDFLKLNIEGAELDVLREVADAGVLSRVRAMVVEYHGWPGGEQRLGAILTLLADAGFRYMVHDQDEQSNPKTKPPFQPPGDAPWFALIYAWRTGTR